MYSANCGTAAQALEGGYGVLTVASAPWPKDHTRWWKGLLQGVLEDIACVIRFSMTPLPLSWRTGTRAKPGAERPAKLAEADDIVAGLVEWCRLLLQDVIGDGEEGQELSDLLVLPSDQVPFLAFDKIADTNRRNALQRQFESFLENGGRRDPYVMAWLLGEALAKALVKCLEHSNQLRECPILGFQNLASSRGRYRICIRRDASVPTARTSFGVRCNFVRLGEVY